MDQIKASENKADLLSAVMARAILVMACALPLFIVFKVYRNIESLNDKKF